MLLHERKYMQQYSGKRFIFLTLCFFMTCFLWACGDNSTVVDTRNSSPAIQSVAASPTSVQIGGSISLSCAATDEETDNNKLSYNWSVTAGSLSSQAGSAVSWTAPSTSGSYTATCTVDDGDNNQTKGDVTITVTPVSGSNNNPTISSVTASSTSLSASETATITVSASDSDGDVIGYSYSATGGTVSGSSSTATYTAPTSAGTYTIQVTVTDGRGGSATGSVSVTVTSSSSGTSETAYEVEPNDSFDTAQLIDANTDYIGQISEYYNYDYFKVVATGSTITVHLEYVSPTGYYYVYWIYIYTDSQSTVANFELSNDESSDSITTGIVSGQTYYIRVYGAVGSQYKLRASFS